MALALLLGRLLLAAVFLAAGVAKLGDLPGSRRAMGEFGVPARAAGMLGTLLPLAELAIAGALIAGPTASWGALAALILLFLFCVAIAWNLSRGRTPDCHCFGQLRSTPASRRTVARNLGLAALAFLLAAGLGALAPAAAIAAAGIAALVAGPLPAWLRRGDGGETTAGDPAGAPEGLPVGTPAPDFRLPGLSGGSHTLDSLRADGRPLLLLFSDRTCGPCIEMAPMVARWQREHSGELTIAVVERDHDGDAVAPDEHGRRDVLLQRESEVSGAYGAQATPSAVLVGREGAIASPVAAGGKEIEALVARSVEGFQPVLARVLPLRPELGRPLRRRELLVRGAGAWGVASFVLAWPARAMVELRRGRRPCPKPWQLRCGDRCIDVLRDERHCGTNCGNLKRCVDRIFYREVCAGGKCIRDTDGSRCNVARDSMRGARRGAGGVPPRQCPGDQICCEGNCVDPTRTPNCGGCGKRPGGRRPACCQGARRDLARDPRHCGQCFHRCPEDKPLCFGGRCRDKCPPGTRRCGSTCGQPSTEVCCGGRVIAKEDMQFDEENCGACGSTCPDEPRYKCCPKRGKGACVNTQTDGEHCSGCGQFCSGLPGAPNDTGCECRNGGCVPRPFYANEGCTTCPCR
jgi:uncharacterized membrane protein YphA (DoxX/SURF4 family)